MDHISTEGAVAPIAKHAPWRLTRSAKAPGPETRLVGMAAAAEMLGISRGYFYRAVLPHLKTIRMSNRQLVEVAEIDRFIAMKRAEADRDQNGDVIVDAERAAELAKVDDVLAQQRAARAAEHDVTPERAKAVDDTIIRRMRNTGESFDDARRHIVAWLLEATAVTSTADA